jgi:hypothetical protein
VRLTREQVRAFVERVEAPALAVLRKIAVPRHGPHDEMIAAFEEIETVVLLGEPSASRARGEIGARAAVPRGLARREVKKNG